MRAFIILIFLSLLYFVSFSQNISPNNKTSNPSIAINKIVDSLNLKAYNLFLTSPDEAHKIASSALLLAEKTNYSLGKGRSFYNIGLINWSQSYYTISLFYLKSAISLLPKNSPLYLSDAYNALGRTYADLKNYKLALAQLDTSLLYAQNNPRQVAEVYNERAYIYYNLKNYSKAIEASDYALKLNRGINATGNIAVLYSRLCVIYTKLKDYKTALKYNDTARDLGIKINNRRLLSYCYVQYAVIDNETAKFDSAIAYSQKSIALADSVGVMDAATKAYDALVNGYEQKGELKKALNFQKEYKIVRDSLNTIAKLKTIKLVQNYYDLNAKMNNIALMESDDKINRNKIKAQNIIITVLVSSLVILSAILFVTFYFYKQKKSLSVQLQQQHTALLDQKQLIEYQTDNLKEVNSLKDKLLAVIGHDLRTPVANLSNMIELFDDGYLTEQEVRDLMRDINPIVKGAELTLSNLMEWAGSQIKGRNINLSNVDIFLLGVEMEQTLLHSLQKKKIEFINRAYPGQGVLADENHLKVILRNLISNAIKFTGYSGNITLTTLIENNELIVSVTDSGKGMSAGEIEKLFYVNTHFSSSGTQGEKGTGIGLLLCKELVELNGGTLAVKSVEDKGSTFYFNLKLHNAYA